MRPVARWSKVAGAEGHLMGTLKQTLTENQSADPVQLALEACDPRRRRCVIMGVFGKS